MDENLIAGEDFDFCQRIRKLNKQVFFNKHSIVYHHDRNLKNFITQKIEIKEPKPINKLPI